MNRTALAGDRTMETWRQVWRQGFAPLFTDPALERLQEALKQDDAAIMQGATTSPPPLLSLEDCDVEKTCVIGYLAWKGYGFSRVGDVEMFFSQACYEADKRLGEAAACRVFLNWYDDTPRNEMRRELLGEIGFELNRRNPIKPHNRKLPARRRRQRLTAVVAA
jgi:hypothetical protein